jgi:predicted nucleic acid-binding Zn ribbon protein
MAAIPTSSSSRKMPRKKVFVKRLWKGAQWKLSEATEPSRGIPLKRTLREQVLAEWRGVAEPAPSPERTVSVKELIAQLAPKLGLQNRLREEEMLAAWNEIVGEFFAQHSRPARLVNGVLFVLVLQPTVLYELDRRWKGMILEKIRVRFGSRLVREIRFSVG